MLYIMKRGITAIRDLDEEIFRKFKAKAVEEGMNLGKALNLAILQWLNKKDSREKDPKNLLKLKTFDWGVGTEKTSKEIDKILYGDKK